MMAAIVFALVFAVLSVLLIGLPALFTGWIVEKLLTLARWVARRLKS